MAALAEKKGNDAYKKKDFDTAIAHYSKVGGREFINLKFNPMLEINSEAFWRPLLCSRIGKRVGNATYSSSTNTELSLQQSL